MSKRGNGEGSISKRPSGTWMGQVTIGRSPTGKPIRKTIYGKSRKQVAEALAKLLMDVQQGLPLGDNSTVREFLGRWLQDSVRPSVRPRTYAEYQRLADRHIIPTLGAIRLTKLTPAEVQRLYSEKLSEGLSPRSVIYVHAVLHRALEQATKWGLVARNVAGLIDRPRASRHEINPLSPAEARAFLDEAKGSRLEALFVLALTTGMRQGEILGLRWQDVDLDGSRLFVRQTAYVHQRKVVFGEPKTHRSTRGITLSAMAVRALRAHRVRQAEERLAAGTNWNDYDLVFTSRVGTPIERHNLNYREFKPLLREAGLREDIRFHDLRHTVASTLLAANVHPKMVQELLGHSQIGVTMNTYSHVLPTTHDEIAEKMDRLLDAG